MTTQNSPSLDDFENGLPDQLPKDKVPARKIIFRILLGLSIGLLIILAAANIIKNNSIAVLTGKGNVIGSVVNEYGVPIEAEIFVIGLDIEKKTDAEGSFTLNNLPRGMQSVVVILNDGGVEYPVQVIPGETVDIGKVQIVTTPDPGD